jgi:hypothetical protein
MGNGGGGANAIGELGITQFLKSKLHTYFFSIVITSLELEGHNFYSPFLYIFDAPPSYGFV